MGELIYPVSAWRRAMRVQEVILKAVAGEFRRE